MRYLLTTTLALMTALPALAQDESSARNYEAMRCDITDEEQLHWSALDQRVTLKTRISKQDPYYARGEMSLILEDGTVLDLGEGFKYIDDADIETLLDCEKHLEVAKTETLRSLALDEQKVDSRYFRTLNEMWAYSVLGQDCMDSANLPEEGPSSVCQLAADFREEFYNSLSESSISDETYRYLRDNEAPIIKVQKSAYYAESYVYDARDNKLYHILTEGC